MEYADKILICDKCGEKFVFSCGEQKFFEEKGFIEPRKCAKCRGKENVKRPTSNTYPITCPSCKKNFNITFNPNDKEILCFDCFKLKQQNVNK